MVLPTRSMLKAVTPFATSTSGRFTCISSRAPCFSALARAVVQGGRPGPTSRSALGFGAGSSKPSILGRSLTPIRSLTSQREKVKVLLVLYDGGKHAEEVREPFSPIPLTLAFSPFQCRFHKNAVWCGGWGVLLHYTELPRMPLSPPPSSSRAFVPVQRNSAFSRGWVWWVVWRTHAIGAAFNLRCGGGCW
jgi:hypothetical protein